MKNNDISYPRDPLLYQLRPEDLSGDYGAFLHRISNVPDCPAPNLVPIRRAGITKQSVYLRLPLINCSSAPRVPVLCEVEAASNLRETRGVHMSRFEECLIQTASGEGYCSLDDFASKLAASILEEQESEESFVKVDGIMLVPRVTRVSGRTSYDRVNLSAEAKFSDGRQVLSTAVQAYNVTACPCTRTFTKFSVVPELLEKGFSLEQVQDILDTVLTGTHLQRGTVTLKVEKTSEAVTSEALYKILDSSTHLVFDLLKRPDEHELVVRALKQPQFTEDVVRDVSAQVVREFSPGLPAETKVEIQSVLLDSIHIHDVFAEVQSSFGELSACLVESVVG